MTHLYIPEQYFEAFAKATSSSRITGRYVVKHFVVQKRFGQKRCSVLTVWDHTEESSQALTSQPHWLRFFFLFFFSSQQYSSFWFRNYSLPKLVGKSASRLHARAAPPFYFRLVFIFIPVRIFECHILA